jgi:glutamate--cysteine ligase catalytic subunit
VNKHTHQQFIPEKIASPHPRFLGLAQSIYERRGEKVNIQVPLYPDENTDMAAQTENEPFPGQIYMDAMHFGMGSSCLQITYESMNINHARYLYDMFLPFTPIMSALSATTPLVKGKVSNHDFRWEIIEQAVDCRTTKERDPNDPEYIPKSRYSTVSRYISNHEYVKDSHNDLLD